MMTSGTYQMNGNASLSDFFDQNNRFEENSDFSRSLCQTTSAGKSLCWWCLLCIFAPQGASFCASGCMPQKWDPRICKLAEMHLRRLIKYPRSQKE